MRHYNPAGSGLKQVSARRKKHVRQSAPSAVRACSIQKKEEMDQKEPREHGSAEKREGEQTGNQGKENSSGATFQEKRT